MRSARRRRSAAKAERIDLANRIILPGLVNAHQHGRGISNIQLGYADDILERWMVGKRRRRPMRPYASTLLAAAEMIAAGVTATIQANTPYGTGDYAGELRDSIRAYEEAGLRAMVGVGAQDRAYFVYPPEADLRLREELSGALAAAAFPARTPYAGDARATIALMHALRAEIGSGSRVSLAYAPAAPHWVSDEMFRDLAADAHRHAIPIHMHALESWAQVRCLQAIYPEGLMRRLEALGVLGPLTSLAHAVWLSADDLAVASRHGVTIVRNPGSNLRLRAGIAPLADYLESGTNIAIGTDNTALNDDEDLLGELRLAAKLAGEPGWSGRGVPGADTLLRMATTAGARAMGLADTIGSIRVGGLADIIAIDRTAFEPYLSPSMPVLPALMARAGARHVRMTMCQWRDPLSRQSFHPHRYRCRSCCGCGFGRDSEGAPGADLVDELLTFADRHYLGNERGAEDRAWQPLARNWDAPGCKDAD